MDDLTTTGASGWIPLPQVVAREIQQLILAGEWASGAKIPSQRALSRKYGVSRASLREALLTLETLGLIRSEPGRGTFVAYGLSPPSGGPPRWRFADAFPLRDVFETRAMLEGRIAAATAGRMEAQALQALSEATDEMEACWDRGDLLANVDADLRFHRIIADACPNRLLRSLYDTVSGLLIETQRQPIPATETARMRGSVGEHRAVVTALRSPDPNAARDAMEVHIRNTAACAGIEI